MSRSRIAFLSVKALHGMICHAVISVAFRTSCSFQQCCHQLRCALRCTVHSCYIKPLFRFDPVGVIPDELHDFGVYIPVCRCFTSVTDIFQKFTEMTFYRPYFCDSQDPHLPSRMLPGFRRTVGAPSRRYSDKPARPHNQAHGLLPQAD